MKSMTDFFRCFGGTGSIFAQSGFEKLICTEQDQKTYQNFLSPVSTTEKTVPDKRTFAIIMRQYASVLQLAPAMLLLNSLLYLPANRTEFTGLLKMYIN